MLGVTAASDRSNSNNPSVVPHLCDLTDQALERQLADQQLGGLLVLPDLTQGDGSGSVPVRLLDAACIRNTAVSSGAT